MKEEMYFKVDTPAMLKEALECGGPDMAIFKIPFNVFQGLLAEVAQRAIELNDPELIQLMKDLKLIEAAEK